MAPRAGRAGGMRLVHWALGIVFGLFTGGAALVLGVLVLLVAIPSLAWGAREPVRPLGLAGWLIGVGAGVGGLVALANTRCVTFDSMSDGLVQSCSPIDLTPYVAFALAMIALGLGLTTFTLLRMRPRTA
jgi:hypothetical protein